jgi:excisionase family DNA binding protein
MNAQVEFYSVREVARILRINVIGVYKLIQNGELRAHRFTERRTRISRNDLSEFIARAKGSNDFS